MIVQVDNLEDVDNCDNAATDTTVSAMRTGPNSPHFCIISK